SSTSFDPGVLDYETTYYWKIVVYDNYGGSNLSSVWHFTTSINHAPSAPTSIALSPSSVYVGTNLVATASGSTDPDGDSITYEYRFYNVDDGVVRQDWGSDNSYIVQQSDAHDTIRVYARAKDSHDATSDSYSVDKEVLNSNPDSPGNPSPSNGTTGVGVDTDLSWSCSDPDGDSLTYDVYFEKDDSSPDVKVSSGQSSTSFDPGVLDYETTYYWKIVVYDNYGGSNLSSVWHFTTANSTVSDIETSIVSIKPYVQTTYPLVLIATGDNDLDNVTLWYRYSIDNITWKKGGAVTDEGRPYEVDIVETSATGWTTVKLDNIYTNPVVVCTSQTGWDNHIENEMTGRPVIKNVTNNSFEVKFLDDEGKQHAVTIGYIVMEKGHHNISGVEFDVGTYTVDTAENIQTVYWNSPFSTSNVVVIDQCQNDTGRYPLSSRYVEGSIGSKSYKVYWEEFDANGGWPGGTLTMGYIAMEAGVYDGFEGGIIDEVSKNIGSNGVVEENDFGVLNFSNIYNTSPILFVNPMDSNGPDPTVVGIYDLTQSGFKYLCAEGDNEDIEQAHATCDIPWIAMEKTPDCKDGWHIWNDPNNPDTKSADGWSWSFNFPEGNGYYEFYSIGMRSGEQEVSPSNADTFCYFALLSQNLSVSGKSVTIHSPDKIEGLVLIDLYNGSVLFGKIWIFDSDVITYKDESIEGGKLLINNGAISYVASQGETVFKKYPSVYENNATLSFYLFQTIYQGKLSVAESGEYTIKSKLVESNLRENKVVYNLKMNFYGIDSENWVNYLTKKYKFSKIESNSIKYGLNGIKFILINYVIKNTLDLK
ncbi:MAG: hypothetical protein J7J89_03690, partial [Thermoplasmata archaeon]|nr:hypothetical protein [Thermoplasmata archaeon]